MGKKHDLRAREPETIRPAAEDKPPQAFGAPGIEPRWTSSAKEGIGTAYNTSSRVWFTLSHGIINEIYYPGVDCPNTRDLQFLITDGESFCHEERRHLVHQLEYPEEHCLLYRISNTEPDGRYRIVKDIFTDPHASVVLIQGRLEILDPGLKDKLRMYVLLAPHLKGLGMGNSAWLYEIGGYKLLMAEREGAILSVGCAPDFLRRSVGFAGYSDGWQDLMDNFSLDWEFEAAEDGNLALTAEIDLSQAAEFTLALAFGRSRHSACAQILRSLAIPPQRHRQRFVEQWRRAISSVDVSAHSGDGGRLAWLSHCLLLAHEDKIYKGALVASLSIPWGETRGDQDYSAYHFVWPRDMTQSALALLAGGRTGTALRALIWLATIQEADGAMPQNSWLSGLAFWKGRQLDEVAAPILLAWQLRRLECLERFDPWTLVARAAHYLIAHGPVTSQERWEENSGYSPSTLAAMIAALVCAADFARDKGAEAAADFMLGHADWLVSHLEAWTVTQGGELLPGTPRHFIRINPADPAQPEVIPDPDSAMLQIANHGPCLPARNVVSTDFLQLVRLGIYDPHDPLIVDSLAVVDHVLRRELPQGPCWRRYNHDCYGQKDDGSAYDGSGTGHCWPLLTGERGHYELAAGRDPLPYIRALEAFANCGGMLSEQLWDEADLPAAKLKRGAPTGAAMPLCWAHAEYLLLIYSHRAGSCCECRDPVYQRYVANRTGSPLEIWSFAYQCRQIGQGKRLRIITAVPAIVHWSDDGWQSSCDSESCDSGIGCWFVDLPTAELPAGAEIVFTFRWRDRWEGRDFRIGISQAAALPASRQLQEVRA